MCLIIAEELREHFSKHGEIESINVKTDPNTGRSRGFAFIVFSQAEAIDKVISLSYPNFSFKILLVLI
jgi:RNA recognition motif-containing protein